MFLVKQGVMPKPSLDTILFNGEEARNSAIPEDLPISTPEVLYANQPDLIHSPVRREELLWSLGALVPA